MKIQSVRFGMSQWELISRMAAEDGVSVSQYVRDASFARAIIHALQSPSAKEAAWLALTDAFTNHPEVLDRLALLDLSTGRVDLQLEPREPEDRESKGPDTQT